MLRISLKAARVNRGFTLIQASKKLGISHTTLVKWERNSENLTPRQQKLVCATYGVSGEFLFFGSELELNSRFVESA